MEKPKPITFQKDIYKKVLEYLPPSKIGKILDVGAGEGYLSRLLKDSGYEVEACDFLKENFKCPDIPFFISDLNKGINCEDNRYDYTISVEVIEHLENHSLFISELFRVTKPGGTVIITTPNILSISSRLHFLIYGYNDCAPKPIDPLNPHYYMEHINPISLTELLFYIEKAGGILIDLTTNRYRKGSIPFILFYPFFSFCLKKKLLRKKYAQYEGLHRRHIKWMLSKANLLGRITIAICKKSS